MMNNINEGKDESEPYCPKCGSDDGEWESCWQCFGEGDFDPNDDDPINYAPGEEYEECSECYGNGGYWVCRECRRRANAAAGVTNKEGAE